MAGGRYDPLIGILGGQETPGIGFGSGIERMILEMKIQEVMVAPPEGPEIIIITVGNSGKASAALATELRSVGVSTILAPKRSLKAQMRYANNQDAANVLILGDREVDRGTVTFKSLAADDAQKEIRRDAATIAEYIRFNRKT